MRNWLAVGVVGVFSAIIVGGCSSSPPPATVSDYCQQVAQTECPPVVSVCAGLSETTCEASVAASCNANAATAEKAGRQFQSGQVGACISALNGVFTQLDPTRQSILDWQLLNGSCGTAAPCSGSPNDTCERVFQGVTADNVACTSTYDCTSSSICGSAGSCGPESDKQLSQGCSDPGDLCTSGTVCSKEPGQASVVCTMGIPVGSSCSATNPCATNAECKAGKCVALGEEGSPCTSNADCDPTSPTAAFCDTSQKKPVCAAGYSFGTGAADCSAFGGAK
jgi:hypothetical protein